MIGKTSSLYMAGLALLFTSYAHSDDSASQDGVTVGAGGQYAPRYSGSDKMRLQPVPFLQARKGALFFDSQKGLGYDIQSDNGLYLEHTLGWGMGRSDRDSDWRDGSDKLRGMGNIKASVNTALALGWSVTPWMVIEGKATLPVSDSQGVNYQTSLTFLPVQNKADTLAIQSAALFGDGRYMNTFYGVSGQQSSRTGYSRYNAPGGFYGVATTVTWGHQFDDHWGSAITAGYTWLGDHAADSPIVFRRDQVMGVMAITYTF
ncbi:MipA/OmpV family protein [Pantoea ananatis]|uniref:MipA/OmpV family protein n=1 Tax=Pantoea ananas TaxID=553 RepID=UPI000D76BE7A|nr:MipA/OmpV family protein [Pantoea ananatis]PXV97480.1 outer membrane scaffolding protein for murein synthesis (MipA/OmpV family) [Pantoea ananatis]